jgi:acetolactate synthase-1/2/3 large subunit
MLFAALGRVGSGGTDGLEATPMARPTTVSDFIARRLVELGVRHVFGVGGANIEDLFSAVQQLRPVIRAVLCKHEHGAGTAADAYARVGHGLGVVFATSGGGTLNLVHALGEARASRVPVLAIVGEPPTELQGRGAFQDTSGKGGGVDAERVLASVAKYCARVESSADVPRLMNEAVAAALGEAPGPAVLLLAKDRQIASLEADPTSGALSLVSRAELDPVHVSAACALLRAKSCVVIAGDEVSRAGAQHELAKLARVLEASVAVTPDARDAFDNGDSRFLGVAGGMGHPEVARALATAEVALVVGTRLPLLARQGLEKLLAERALVWLGREAPFVTTKESRGVPGAVERALRALAEVLEHEAPRRTPRSVTADAGPPTLPAAAPERDFTSKSILAAIEREAPPESIILVDAGNTGAAAAHGLRVPKGGGWLLAMGMAGMGWAFGGSIGAALASGRRCFVLAGDGAFFMHGFEIHTALEHELPITFVVFNNRAHGMCLVRERLLLRTDAGYNEFRPSHLGAGIAAMFPGLTAVDCTNLGELEDALARAVTKPGPSVVAVELEGVEVPPFAAFQAAGGAAFSRIERSKPP